MIFLLSLWCFTLILTFNIRIEAGGQSLALKPVIEDGDPDLVPGEDDMGAGAALGHSVPTPPGLETIVLSLYLADNCDDGGDNDDCDDDDDDDDDNDDDDDDDDDDNDIDKDDDQDNCNEGDSKNNAQ